MDPVDHYDLDPVRPGAAPRLDVGPGGTGLTARAAVQPVWEQITAAVVAVLRAHFSVQSRIEHPDLVERVYAAAAPERSPIQIDSLARWRPENAGQRPALLVDRLDQDRDLARRAIGDQFMGVRPGHFGWVKTGQHVVHCLGGREGEAEILAWEVERDLARFAPVIRDALCLLRFLPVKTGKRVKIEDLETEHYTVPVVLAYGYQEAARVAPLDESEITEVRVALGLQPL